MIYFYIQYFQKSISLLVYNLVVMIIVTAYLPISAIRRYLYYYFNNMYILCVILDYSKYLDFFLVSRRLVLNSLAKGWGEGLPDLVLGESWVSIAGS